VGATFAQTVTTTTHCNIDGDSATCMSTDDAAQQKALADARAANQKAIEDAGAALGNAVGNAFLRARINKGIRKYCDQHPGEPSYWQENGQVVWRGTCCVWQVHLAHFGGLIWPTLSC